MLIAKLIDQLKKTRMPPLATSYCSSRALRANRHVVALGKTKGGTPGQVAGKAVQGTKVGKPAVIQHPQPTSKKFSDFFEIGITNTM